MHPANQLQRAYVRSGLTPEQFYMHIISTRNILAQDDDNLAFKVLVEYDGYDDLTWFGWLNNRWQEL